MKVYEAYFSRHGDVGFVVQDVADDVVLDAINSQGFWTGVLAVVALLL